MESSTRKSKILCTSVAVAASALSSWACIWDRTPVVPFPVILPALTLSVSVVALLQTWYKIPRTWLDGRTPILSQLAKYIFLLPFTLAILAAVYTASPDFRSCNAETYWEQLFRSKNEVVVRRIQDQLQCCGFNSMRDRAWPFQSVTVDARECERTLGFHTQCGPLLKRRMLLVAILSLLASIMNTVLLLVFPFNFSDLMVAGYRRTSNHESEERRRLLARPVEHIIQETLDEEDRRVSQRE